MTCLVRLTYRSFMLTTPLLHVNLTEQHNHTSLYSMVSVALIYRLSRLSGLAGFNYLRHAFAIAMQVHEIISICL